MSHSIRPVHPFAECCVFVKQSHGPVYCASRHYPGGPLLPKLRGYVAEFLNEVSLARLGILVPSHLCRSWYGRHIGIVALFWEAWVHGLAAVWPAARRGGSPPRGRRPSAPATALLRCDESSPPCRCGNVCPLSIGYALRPGLRSRLTPGGRTLPGKPWDSGDRDSRPVFRYSCPHNRYREVHHRSRAWLRPVPVRSPTVVHGMDGPRIRFRVYSRSFSARGLSSSQLLRTV